MDLYRNSGDGVFLIKTKNTMPAYYPVHCCRSDGQRETPGRDGIMEPNQPTPDQLSQRVQKDKDGSYKDYYRKVERGSEKDIDWRRKLGGMLMHLAGTPEQLKKNWILHDFPEDYTLWEHVKYAVDQNGQAKKSGSTHAAGGMERQDAYLYGHPQGRKKRYRSPTEFFEHFLWLVADDPKAPTPCQCKICLPVLPEEVERGTDERGNGNQDFIDHCTPHVRRQLMQFRSGSSQSNKYRCHGQAKHNTNSQSSPCSPFP